MDDENKYYSETGGSAPEKKNYDRKVIIQAIILKNHKFKCELWFNFLICIIHVKIIIYHHMSL